jgi:D-3-phosphoglycerate dehydrogenase
MNDAAFAAMQPTAYFINASRGNLVDEAALLRALEAGQIAGCALDVGRAPDQMPSPDLARHPRLRATPHIGGLTPSSIEHQSLETVAQVTAIVRGQIPPGAVNAEHARRLQARFPLKAGKP